MTQKLKMPEVSLAERRPTRVPGIVWLASYPKSGNTWLRFLLSALLYGPFERSREIATRIPDLHKEHKIAIHQRGFTIVKTHLPWSHAHPGAIRTSGAILVTRHPLDVAVSIANHVCRNRHPGASDKDVAAVARQLIDLFIQTGGFAHTPAWRRFGTWSQHALSWRNQTRFPVLWLTYESMLDAPADALTAVARFLNTDATDSAISDAVNACSFERLAQLEQAETEVGEPGIFLEDTNGRPDRRFINRGTTGQWQQLVSEKVVDIARERHGHAVAELGYVL